MLAWLVVAGPVVAFGLLKTLASVADQDEKVAYETFAKSVNGRIYQNKRLFSSRTRAIEFLDRGLRVVVDTEQRGSGRDSLQYARVTLDLPRPIAFQCDLSPHGMLDSVLKPGHQVIQLGSSVFDDEFRVTTNNETMVVQVLDETIQPRLMQLKEFSKAIRAYLTASGRVFFLIDAQRIQIRVLGVISKPEEMTEFHRQFSELFNELLPRLGLTP